MESARYKAALKIVLGLLIFSVLLNLFFFVLLMINIDKIDNAEKRLAIISNKLDEYIKNTSTPSAHLKEEIYSLYYSGNYVKAIEKANKYLVKMKTLNENVDIDVYLFRGYANYRLYTKLRGKKGIYNPKFKKYLDDGIKDANTIIDSPYKKTKAFYLKALLLMEYNNLESLKEARNILKKLSHSKNIEPNFLDKINYNLAITYLRFSYIFKKLNKNSEYNKSLAMYNQIISKLTNKKDCSPQVLNWIKALRRN